VCPERCRRGVSARSELRPRVSKRGSHRSDVELRGSSRPARIQRSCGCHFIRRLQSAGSAHLLVGNAARAAAPKSSGKHQRPLDGRRRRQHRNEVRVRGTASQKKECREARIESSSGESSDYSNHARGGSHSRTLNKSRVRGLGHGRWCCEAKAARHRRVEPRRAPRPTAGNGNSARESVATGSAHPAERRGGCRPLRTCHVRTLGQRSAIEATMG